MQRKGGTEQPLRGAQFAGTIVGSFTLFPIEVGNVRAGGRFPTGVTRSRVGRPRATRRPRHARCHLDLEAARSFALRVAPRSKLF